MADDLHPLPFSGPRRLLSVIEDGPSDLDPIPLGKGLPADVPPVQPGVVLAAQVADKVPALFALENGRVIARDLGIFELDVVGCVAPDSDILVVEGVRLLPVSLLDSYLRHFYSPSRTLM